MAERATIARPFATALFRHGSEKAELEAWTETLQALKLCCETAPLQELFRNPRVQKKQLSALVTSLVAAQLPETGARFIDLLTESGRLDLLPEICAIFAQLRRDHEKRAAVVITSAMEIGQAHHELISRALERRLGCQVTITTVLDPALVGGATIRVGDQVIDGSMRGRLEQLAQQLGQ